jgi:HNH endonuclease
MASPSSVAGFSKKDEARFWGNVSRQSGCWIWVGCIGKHGYGLFCAEGKRLRSHRVSYMLKIKNPGNLSVLHKCDNPCCVNPKHLFLGNQLDNMRDASLKGRNKTYKISPKDIGDIKTDLLNRRKLKDISNQYGVSINTLSLIRRGKIWVSA